MITHFNMVAEQAKVMKSNLTATYDQKEFPHAWLNVKEIGLHKRGRLKDIIK